MPSSWPRTGRDPLRAGMTAPRIAQLFRTDAAAPAAHGRGRARAGGRRDGPSPRSSRRWPHDASVRCSRTCALAMRRARAVAPEERRPTDHCECTCEPQARVHEQCPT
jgi:hypothetical protein